MTAGGSELPELKEVRLLRVPVAMHARAAEHQADLQREFELIAKSPNPPNVAPRLLALIERLEGRYDAFTAGPMHTLESAAAEGIGSLDLVFMVPPDAGPAAQELAGMMAEVDQFCRSGQELLTLAASEEIVRYREWFLGEFARQLAGAEPRAWDEAAFSRD